MTLCGFTTGGCYCPILRKRTNTLVDEIVRLKRALQSVYENSPLGSEAREIAQAALLGRT